MEPLDTLSPDLRQRFAHLRRQFVSGLSERVQELDAAPDAQARASVLHRLSGAAGAYGFAQLSQLARTAELNCLDASCQADLTGLAELRCEVAKLSAHGPGQERGT